MSANVQDDKPVGKHYEGHSGIGRDSPWLTAEDFEARGVREARLTVREVQRFDKVKFEGGRVKEIMVGLAFKGQAKVLGLNRTNTKAMNAMFGKLTKEWAGKTVTVFITQTRLGRETVDCLRIREDGTRAATPAESIFDDDEPADATPATSARPDTMKEIDEACAKLGFTAEEKAARLTACGGNLAALSRELTMLVDEREAADA